MPIPPVTWACVLTGFKDPQLEARYHAYRMRTYRNGVRLTSVGLAVLCWSVSALLAAWSGPHLSLAWSVAAGVALIALGFRALNIPAGGHLNALAYLLMSYSALVLAEHWLAWTLAAVVACLGLAVFALRPWEQLVLYVLALGLVLVSWFIPGSVLAAPSQAPLNVLLPTLGLLVGLNLQRTDRRITLLQASLSQPN